MESSSASTLCFFADGNNRDVCFNDSFAMAVTRAVAFDWIDMLQHVLTLYQPFAARKSLPIVLQTEENAPRWILGVWHHLMSRHSVLFVFGLNQMSLVL